MKLLAATLVAVLLALDPVSADQAVSAVRLAQNPQITVETSPSLGGNVNGPSVIRVPDWIERPLGRYYMYFANHTGAFIRLAYADAPTGPWKVFEPGVLHVKDTAFFRPQPDPKETAADFYTHIASPEVLVDPANKRLLMWVHGWWTNGERWPNDPAKAAAWARQNGYGQYTQLAESIDGVHFVVRPPITKGSYLRVFQYGGYFYGVSRLGQLWRSKDPLASFDPGPNVFQGSAYANRVRHVALLVRGGRLLVFFTGIGDAPERILLSTVDLAGDWSTWRATAPVEVLRPEAPYECADLPEARSEPGDVDGRVRQIRDPFVLEEQGRTLLFYSTCGEQGIAAATLTFQPGREQILSAAFDVMKAARYCTLITLGPGGHPQARIVDPLIIDKETSIWIATNPLSRKVGEINRDGRVTLMFFDTSRNDYVTVLAKAVVVTDAARKAAHWKPEWSPFYKEQTRGADFQLFEIQPFRLEVSAPSRGINNDPKTWQPVILDYP